MTKLAERKPVRFFTVDREQTRTREQGTRITMPANGEQRIEALRRIVENHQYEKIDGQMVDGFTASGIVQVYDALSETNREKYRNMNVSKMADVMWKLSKVVRS